MDVSRCGAAGIVVGVFLTLSCSKEGLAASGPTPSNGASPPAAAAPSGPLLVGLWKGYVPSLERSVFIAWVKPKSTSKDDVRAAVNDAYTLITPKLQPTPYQMFIVNVYVQAVSAGNLTTEVQGFIFVRDQHDHWTETAGAGLTDEVIHAGLPGWPGSDGAVRVSVPLGSPEP